MHNHSLLVNSCETEKLKIALVDDHSLLRDALGNVINNFDTCKVILRASNGVDLVEQLQICSIPDVVILDLNMPVMDGYETTYWLKCNCPNTHILVLSMFDSEISIIRLLQLGVKAFLRKDTHPNELKHAIHSLVTDGQYYPQTISGKLANMFNNPEKRTSVPPMVLTEKEILFLKYCCTDLTYKQMAKLLYVSDRTIDNYRDQLFKKLSIKSRVALAVYAVKNGIVNFNQ